MDEKEYKEYLDRIEEHKETIEIDEEESLEEWMKNLLVFMKDLSE